jgi:uncharacterized protein
MRSHLIHVLTTLFLASLAVAGCNSDKPTRLYRLTAAPAQPVSASTQGVAIGVGPITLPKYLDRPQMVTGVSGNQMAQANFDQWGGELNDNMTRVLASNLSNLLGTDQVSLYPWTDQASVNYQVTIDVTQFEQDADGRTVLSAFWSILDPKDGHQLIKRRSTYRDSGTAQPAAAASMEAGAQGGADGYDAIAAAMSRDLTALSRDIAAAIAALKTS